MKNKLITLDKFLFNGNFMVFRMIKKTIELIGDTFLNIESEILENFRRRCKNY